MSNIDRNSQNVFVVIKGKTCGFCRKLTSQVPEIKKRIETKGLTFIEYEIDEMWKPPNGEKGKYPESLGYLGMWYPFIFCTSSDNWNLIKSGKDLRNQITILNGSFNGKEYVLGKQTYNPLNLEHLTKWIDDISSKTVITNQVISPKKLIGSSNEQSTIPENKDKIKNDKKMKIIPRKKYGK